MVRNATAIKRKGALPKRGQVPRIFFQRPSFAKLPPGGNHNTPPFINPLLPSPTAAAAVAAVAAKAPIPFPPPLPRSAPAPASTSLPRFDENEACFDALAVYLRAVEVDLGSLGG